jgi:hypothetical protein
MALTAPSQQRADRATTMKIGKRSRWVGHGLVAQHPQHGCDCREIGSPPAPRDQRHQLIRDANQTVPEREYGRQANDADDDQVEYAHRVRDGIILPSPRRDTPPR